MLSAAIVTDVNGGNGSACMILDMNAGGAQISTSTKLNVGAEVCLLDTANRETFLAKVAWSTSDRAGLAFHQRHSVEFGLPQKFNFVWKLLFEAKLKEAKRAVAMGAPVGPAFRSVGLGEENLHQMERHTSADRDFEAALLEAKRLLGMTPSNMAERSSQPSLKSAAG